MVGADCKPIQRNPYLWPRYMKGRQQRKYDRVKKSQLVNMHPYITIICMGVLALICSVYKTIIWEIAGYLELSSRKLYVPVSFRVKLTDGRM